MTSKEPSFTFYPTDALSLTYEEVGAYMALLTRQHHSGPFTKDRFERLCHGVNWNAISHLFHETTDGLYYSKRLRDDMDKTKKFKEGRAKNLDRFKKPELSEVMKYFNGKNVYNEAEKFMDFYESKGWVVGKTKMRSWKAAASGWIRRSKENGFSGSSQKITPEEGKYGNV